MEKNSLDASSNEIVDNIALFSYFLSFGVFAAGPIILAIQALIWLRAGVWPDFDIYSFILWIGVTPPETSWIGLQQIVDSLLSLPMWLACPVFSAVMLWIFTHIWEK